MNVLIAKTKEECKVWTDNLVVVDVLRSATTICQLLQGGNRNVRVFEEVAKAVAFKEQNPQFTVYSELEFPQGFAHEDNSPYVASKADAKTPALVVTTAGTKALFGARQANQIFMGGFCNFYELAAMLKGLGRDVLLVPSALFANKDDAEDFLCVSALKDFLQGFGNAEMAVNDVRNTLRYVEFIKHGPKTAQEDAAIALHVNGLPVVPTFKFADGKDYAECYPYGEPEPVAAAQGPAQQEAVVMPSLADIAPAPAPQEDTRAKTHTHTGQKLKGFFSGFLKAVKEEEKELLETFRKEDKPIRPAESLAKPAPFLDPVEHILQETTAPAEQKTVEPEPVSATNPSTDKAKISLTGSRKKKAIVLFSGGLDSTTCLYWALDKGYECEALTVSYGQRHDREVLAAQMITRNLGVKHHLITLDLPWLSCCSLVDKNQKLPDVALEDIPKEGIPSTYVPGRNLMFLSIAGSLLDAVEADAIIAGPNAVDFSGYPDCTPAFFKAAGEALNRGTKRGVREGIEVLAPLMELSKTDIVRLGAKLKVPFELTWSCYAGGKKPCGHCDSCKLRAKGFAEAGVHDTSLD